MLEKASMKALNLVTQTSETVVGVAKVLEYKYQILRKTQYGNRRYHFSPKICRY